MFDVIVIGAGPGGLTCAKATAAAGLRTLVLERNDTIGKKVCAGGITWNGLIQHLPSELAERTFCRQHLCTPRQQAIISATDPIIATVDRVKLGQEMAALAINEGVELRSPCQAVDIRKSSVLFRDKRTGRSYQEGYRFLVGADGSSSLVRRYLQQPTTELGIGINYELPGEVAEMEWHLDSSLFASGYAWVFPHRDYCSVGAYAPARTLRALQLKQGLKTWATRQGYQLKQVKAQAEVINYDFRKMRYGNIFLVGDAAGLASGLTGEGIYPAILSGQAVAQQILNPETKNRELVSLIKRHRLHRRMVRLASTNSLLCRLLSEAMVFLLKKKVIDFSNIEMAPSTKSA